MADLKTMPHLLIAGLYRIGQERSASIQYYHQHSVYKPRPDEVKLILIDPKVVELGNYNGIPHMLIPVVTDPTEGSRGAGLGGRRR